MKILFVDQYNKIGGGQTVLIQLISIALKNKHTISLLIPPGGEITNYIPSEVKIISLKGFNIGQRKNIWGYLKILFSLITFFKYKTILKNNDLIYVNGPRCFTPVAFFSLFYKTKIIYHIHLNHKGIEKTLISFISKLNNTKKIVVNSEFVLKKFQTSVEPSKLYLLENSLTENFTNLKFEKKFTEKGTINFAVIGRIAKEKGQHLLVKIAKELPKNSFYIIGDNDFASPEYFNSLKENATPNMIFYGKTFNIIETIKSLPIHVSIVPSVWEEPFGLVAIESMACSCLTMVSEKGELRNIASKTKALTYNDVGDLLKKIQRLVNSSYEELNNLAEAQFRLTQNYYHNSKFIENFNQLLIASE